MAAPNTGVCAPWAGLGDVTTGPCAEYGFDPSLLEDGLQVASDVLFQLTGRQWPGVCTDTIRPCGYRTTTRWASGGVLYGWCGCHRSGDCGCGGLAELTLPNTPAIAVTEVKVDGVALDPTVYRLDNWRHLVRLDDEGWPCCQDLSAADTEDDTWSVTYTYGGEPPLGGVKAAAALGCQFALGWSGSADCKLPKRVTSISRQGITMAILDPLTLFRDGLTGITEVDLWVASVNIGRQRRSASVWAPGQGRQGVRRAGT